MKKIINVLLAVLMLLSLGGCQKNIDNEESNIENVPETFVPYEIMTAVDSDINILNFSSSKDKVIIFWQKNITDESNFMPNELGSIMIPLDKFQWEITGLIFDSECEKLNEIKYYTELEEGAFIDHTAATIDYDGNVWLLNRKFNFTRAYSAAENGARDDAVENYLTCIDDDGNVLRTINIAFGDIVDDWTEQYYNSANKTLIIGDDGNFYLFLGGWFGGGRDYIFAFNQNGDKILEMNEYREQKNRIRGIVKLNSGQITAVRERQGDYPKYELLEIDTGKKDYGEKWDLNADYIDNETTYTHGNETHSILIKSMKAIYSYNIETGESVKLIDWAERGIDIFATQSYRYAALVDDRHVYSFLFEQSENGETFQDGKFNLVRLAIPADNQVMFERKTITAAALFPDNSMRTAIADFNKNSSEYAIQLKAYENADINEAIKDFNIYITSGNEADIVLAGQNFISLDNYASKGLFADLYEFMDNTPDFDRDDYLPNVFKGLETDGKLFIGANSFYISTLIGKTEIVGENKGWTWDEYNALLAKQPTGITPIANEWDYITNKNFLEYMLYSNMSEFVDFKAGTCSFESAGFIELLKAADSYPAEPDRVLSPDAYRNGNPLLMQVNVASFVIHKIFETARFGGDITFIGFPAESGNGSYGRADSRFAILK
ncbi:MAG: hypothetical protein FWG90_14025, partial [Oscillospiraceae bacterium]|nr:hypothetical protein [Oscillospiraceae bacterium]